MKNIGHKRYGLNALCAKFNEPVCNSEKLL